MLGYNISATASILLQLCIATIVGSLTLVSIIRLRTKHPQLIYTLFYLYSLMLCLGVVAIYLKAKTIGVAPPSEDTLIDHIFTFLSSLFDIGTDIEVLFFVSFLTIVPQLLTYIVAGIFGCAVAPRFVRTIFQYCVFSIAKTTICFAGFSCGIILMVFFEHGDINVGTFFFDTLLMKWTKFIAISGFPFCIVYCYYIITSFNVDNASPRLAHINKFMTRFSNAYNVAN
jgi:hypothetical protein